MQNVKLFVLDVAGREVIRPNGLKFYPSKLHGSNLSPLGLIPIQLSPIHARVEKKKRANYLLSPSCVLLLVCAGNSTHTIFWYCKFIYTTKITANATRATKLNITQIEIRKTVANITSTWFKLEYGMPIEDCAKGGHELVLIAFWHLVKQPMFLQ